jgi:hypothetical protein
MRGRPIAVIVSILISGLTLMWSVAFAAEVGQSSDVTTTATCWSGPNDGLVRQRLAAACTEDSKLCKDDSECCSGHCASSPEGSVCQPR